MEASSKYFIWRKNHALVKQQYAMLLSWGDYQHIECTEVITLLIYLLDLVQLHIVQLTKTINLNERRLISLTRGDMS